MKNIMVNWFSLTNFLEENNRSIEHSGNMFISEK